MENENRDNKQRKKVCSELVKLPEVQAGRGVWQNPFHEWDVYGHTLMYVKFMKELTSDLELVVAGYLHDIGKPVVKTLKIENGVVQEKAPGKPYHKFDDHEVVGKGMVHEMDNTLFDKYSLDQDRIARLVGAHYLPTIGIKAMRRAINQENFVKEYHRLEEVLDETGLPRKDVMDMFLADCLSKGRGCTDIEELKAVRTAILTDGSNLEAIYNIQKETYGNKE